MDKVEVALSIHPKKTGAQWTRDHLLALSISVGTVILIVIAYLAWWQPQWKSHADEDLAQRIDNRIEEKLKAHRFDDLVENVHKMQGQMTEISSFMKILLLAETKRVASLAPQEFQKNLPAVRAALDVAQKTPIEIPAETVAEIKTKLNKTPPSAPEFWQTAAAVINYHVGESTPSFPRCRMDQAPAELAESINATQTTIKLKAIPFENCEVVLDSPEVQSRFLNVLGTIDIEFRHCRVVYRGGPIFFPAQVVPGRKTVSVIFTNCVFDLSTLGVPPRDAQQMLSGLLASQDPKSVKLTISS
jgi:hypothetical protein